MTIDRDRPFVLLDDARPGGAPARLFTAPAEIVRADTPTAVMPALERLEALETAGHRLAGFLSYEAGAALAPRPVSMAQPALPLLWFAAFDRCDTIEDLSEALPDPASAYVGHPDPTITRADYREAFASVEALIAAGDIYQANLTFRALVPILGDPVAAFAAIRPRAAAGWGGVVWTGQDWLLSFSPELFFTRDGGRLMTRPMKGTAARLPDPVEDRVAAAALAADPKQRAENLMIVDLLRNDLTRVATPGSVAVDALFTVETYPTVHQMTSTVGAQLAEGETATAVLRALFPCGSVTGAPKQRAMEVIAAVEPAARGIYTGTIGAIDGDRARFNVAIRTLHLPAGADRAVLGLGSGVVADSTGDEEWRECLAKGAFLTGSGRVPDLIETMAFDPEQGLMRLELHLARMKASAVAMGFTFDRHAARNELQAATFRLRGPRRVRLLLARSGAVAIEVGPMPLPATEPVTIRIVPMPVAPDDFRLAHKTSARRFYDQARRDAGSFEVVFVRPDGLLTEGSFTNLFVARGDTLVTPPLGRGLLPGVLREDLIAQGKAVEGDLRASDLDGTVWVGNAVRGLMRAAVAKDG